MGYNFILYFLLFKFSFSSGSVIETQYDDNNSNDTTAISQEEHEISTDCHEICGCDRAYVFNITTNQCNLNMDYILKTSLKQNEKKGEYENEDHDVINDDGMAKRIRLEVQKVFKGIIVSVIIFMACASLCAVSACVYCCHINYSDRKLNSDIKALAKKLKRNYTSKNTVRRAPLEPIEESCNVVVGNAGLYVV